VLAVQSIYSRRLGAFNFYFYNTPDSFLWPATECGYSPLLQQLSER